ncbi:MAG: carboxypeptidase regulatory-like domain-containing protein [bacterium]|nr:carboxypeptidase regulatory-like domain-containing protein [bacterium]
MKQRSAVTTLAAIGCLALCVAVWVDARRASSRSFAREQAPAADEPIGEAARQEAAKDPEQNVADARQPAARARVRRGSTPLARHVVRLSTLGTHATFETDAQGTFELDLDPTRWAFGPLATATVRDPQGQLLLESLVRLDDPIELVVPTPVELHGRLRCSPDVDYGACRVRAFSNVYCGSGRLNADGVFRLVVTEPAPSGEFLLSFFHGDEALAASRVKRDALTSEAGATIDVQWKTVAVHTRGEHERTLAGVELRVARSTDQAPLLARTTDAHGSASLSLVAGEYVLTVGASGYAPALVPFEVETDAEPQFLIVPLRPLAADDVLRGRVLSPIEEPIAGATVRIQPTFGALGSAATIVERSDSDGRFDVPWDARTLFDVVVEHPEHGTLERAAMTCGDRRLQLRYKGTGTVRVEVGGPVQYFLLEEERVVRSGWAHGTIELDGLALGAYRLLVLGAGRERYGEQQVAVSGLTPTTTSMELTSCRMASGTRSAGSLVRAVHPTWPTAVVEAWARTICAADGSYELPVGEAEGVEIVLE